MRTRVRQGGTRLVSDAWSLQDLFPKGAQYQYGTKYDFCSSNFPYGLGKYSPYGYLGPFGIAMDQSTQLGCHSVPLHAGVFAHTAQRGHFGNRVCCDP